MTKTAVSVSPGDWLGRLPALAMVSLLPSISAVTLCVLLRYPFLVAASARTDSQETAS